MERTARSRPPFAGGAFAAFPSPPVNGFHFEYADHVGNR